MTFAVIVQARLGSSRLPGKTLADIAGAPALVRCLDRCAATPGVDAVVCAVPEGSKDDPVAELAASAGYVVARGSEHDVLARYAAAARLVRADVVMRVTSDCPLIDPEVCGQVRDLLTATGADYAANNLPPSFPHGLDCDVFPAELLYQAACEALSPYEREHVTPWMRQHRGLKKAALIGPAGGRERLRWTLDHPEDLAFFRALFDEMGEEAATASWRAIAAVCDANPDLAAINMMHHDAARLAAAATADVPVTLSAAA